MRPRLPCPCAEVETPSVCAIARVPVWAFRGASDFVVPPSRAIEFVRALERCGGNVRFTLYPNTGHDSWTPTYRNPEVYDWMLLHSRGGRRLRRAAAPAVGVGAARPARVAFNLVGGAAARLGA